MDIEHYYVEKGCGEPLILLHGNGESSEYFRGQIDAFAKWFHVYAIDTRGHGKTPRGEKPFTILQFAEDLLGFMDDHHIERAHLLGFSDGGNIAMIFAMQHPDRVERLILNGANLNSEGVKRSTQIPIEIGYRIANRFSGKSESARLNAETTRTVNGIVRWLLRQEWSLSMYTTSRLTHSTRLAAKGRRNTTTTTTPTPRRKVRCSMRRVWQED